MSPDLNVHSGFGNIKARKIISIPNLMFQKTSLYFSELLFCRGKKWLHLMKRK